MKASELRQLMAEHRDPNKKIENAGHTTITVKGPKGEETAYLVRNTTTEEYYSIVDALHEFKYEIDKGRRGSVEDATTLRKVQQDRSILGEGTQTNGEVSA